MNERIRQLADQADVLADNVIQMPGEYHPDYGRVWNEKFAELIVEECRTVINDLYHKTPLELCGPLLTADEEIAKHFYGVEE